MKVILLCLLLAGLPSGATTQLKTGNKVYVCVSSGAYAYHNNKDCRGLNNCTHTIKYVTEEEAISTYKKKKKCGYCY